MNKKIVLVAVSVLSLPFSTQAGSFLSGEEISEALSGKTLHWEHMFKNKSGKSFYGRDGLLVGVANGSKREGKWHISGSDVCVSWEKCLALESDGKGGYYKVKNGKKRVVHIKAAEDGNTL